MVGALELLWACEWMRFRWKIEVHHTIVRRKKVTCAPVLLLDRYMYDMHMHNVCIAHV